MHTPPSLTVISLGGGVQSSVMALMASGGAFDRVPDCAIFADTRWEPPSVYEHLEWLAGQLRFPVHVVDNGRSLREDVKALTNHSGSRNYVDIPVYLKGRDGGGATASPGGNAPTTTRSGPSAAGYGSCSDQKGKAASQRGLTLVPQNPIMKSQSRPPCPLSLMTSARASPD